jgi:hypothetical protein
MKGIVASWAVAAAMMAACVCALLVAACSDSHRANAGTSGSNWLTCKKLADCTAMGAVNAVACSAEGLCVDAEGETVGTRPKQAGSTQPISTAGSNAPEPRCAWTIDGLLAEVGVMARERMSCGRYDVVEVSSISGAMQCFERAVAAGAAVELAIDSCIGCTIPTTYLTTAAGQHFAITREDDLFGDDDLREAKVQTCSAIGFDAGFGKVSCVDPVEVYQCSEPMVGSRPAEPPLPVTPLKLSNVPWPADVPKEKLHLYVSNQSFDEPLVNIEVSIDETRVATGDFALEGQHSWHEFEILVPMGTHTLSVWSGSNDASLDQAIDLTGERWAVVSYWNEGSLDSETFSLALHDEPVTFE